MAKARELKGRIRSVQNTRKITRTMEMVSTSKLKRAQDRVEAARPYAERLSGVIRRLLTPELAARYPLLRQPATVRRAAVVLLTSNRGLAGAFNANLIREARSLMARLRAEGAEAELHISGKKGISFFRFANEQLRTAIADIGDRPGAADAQRLVDELMAEFVRGEMDAVYVVYAKFNSALSTPPTTMQLLPVAPPAAEAEAAAGAQADVEYLLEPSGDEILGRILPLYVRNSVYRALVETSAAEHGARRTAMKNATDNAGDILETLTRTYNRVRQAAITQEIAEIVGGAAALE
ncbi:F0F1 ATP synthase subunit gamma [Longimicrobium terrae]|uniref:ATP synthase gamma chain n=1 Tax=Longimicrobium terrae TaxID=1639882 RepID=A0A841H298_9BACT|nr:F0F1 ATP synthase subunit gamma [Longimicrobium terrae]MBB4637602.1 F-type H+-transporting ATPase subunit gamma [Longimicrobium terrae]MBB6071999.1 F-type H+-transporting ATPase subunit gamma [Longimicrobium terrae]NNC29914.1 F0F1 ATP synthase subunit gamma [Longimicrobium terrae]